MYASDFWLVKIIVNYFSNQLRNYSKHKQCQCVININLYVYTLCFGKGETAEWWKWLDCISTGIVRDVFVLNQA